MSRIITTGENDQEFAIIDISPNPFNDRTAVKHFITEAGEVKFVLYDLSGRKAASLQEVSELPVYIPWL